jgi:hypothetical protein
MRTQLPPPPYQQLQQQYGAGARPYGGWDDDAGDTLSGGRRNPHPVHGRRSIPIGDRSLVELPRIPTVKRTTVVAPPPYPENLELVDDHHQQQHHHHHQQQQSSTFVFRNTMGGPTTTGDSHHHRQDQQHHHQHQQHQQHQQAALPPWARLAHVRDAAPPTGLQTSLDLLEATSVEERRDLLSRQTERLGDRTAGRGAGDAGAPPAGGGFDRTAAAQQHGGPNPDQDFGYGDAIQVNEDVVEGLVSQERAVLEAALRSDGNENMDDFMALLMA